jgi:hypothetical protein
MSIPPRAVRRLGLFLSGLRQTLPAVVATMSNEIKEDRFSDAAEFLANLRGCHARWGAGVETPWVFRGQSAMWPLVPSAFRPQGQELLASITRRYAELTDDAWLPVSNLLAAQLAAVPKAEARNRYCTAYYQTAAEFDAMVQFSEAADRLAIELPPSPRRLRDINHSYDPFVGFDPDGPTEFPFDDVEFTEIFGFGQHHGIPTRLLDWTENAVIAAYFAVGHSADGDDDLAVFALNLSLLPPNGRLRVLRCGRALHTFLHAQAGLFLFNPTAHWDYLRRGSWETLDSIILSEFVGAEPALVKLTLASSARGELLRLLWRENVTRAHLMPTLDNISKALQEKWRLVSGR